MGHYSLFLNCSIALLIPLHITLLSGCVSISGGSERTKVRIKNTLVITARQIQLTEADALPAIEERLERIIPEILP